MKDPIEIGMGSPQYGWLIVDGKPTEKRDIESESLVWSDDRRVLAAQKLARARKCR